MKHFPGTTPLSRPLPVRTARPTPSPNCLSQYESLYVRHCMYKYVNIMFLKEHYVRITGALPAYS
jgi:hypothetical protein